MTTESRLERLARLKEILAALETQGRICNLNQISKEFGFSDSWLYSDNDVKAIHRDYFDRMKELRKVSVEMLQRSVMEPATAASERAEVVAEVLQLKEQNQALQQRVQELESRRLPNRDALLEKLQQQKAALQLELADIARDCEAIERVIEMQAKYEA